MTNGVPSGRKFKITTVPTVDSGEWITQLAAQGKYSLVNFIFPILWKDTHTTWKNCSCSPITY